MKTKQLLGTTDADVNVRILTKQKPTEAEVLALAALLPGGVRDILSTRGRRYREMGLAGRDLTDDEVLALLVTEPGLWRRPIVVRDKQAVVGYDAKSLEALLS